MRPHPAAISRRDAFRAGVAILLAPGVARSADALSSIRGKGKAAGLGPFQEAETASFRGIGDAPAGFMAEALGVCEALAVDYRKQFTRKGFDLSTPPDKLLIVVLSSPRAYAAFEKQSDLEVAIGGHYDLGGNYQVTFDFRKGRPEAAGTAERLNTFALVHETIHQLTFNTGVLALGSDVPVAISEGLATYAETWRPKGKGEIGTTNRLRLDGRRSIPWIPLARILADDDLFRPESKLSLVAYAEAWLLVHHFLKDASRLASFRAYLDAIRKRPDPKRRLDVAAEHLGDLSKLDRPVQRSA